MEFVNLPYADIKEIYQVISDIDNDTIDTENGYGDRMINVHLHFYIDKSIDKEKTKKKIKDRIKKIENETLGLYELKIIPDDDDDKPVQIRYDSGETMLLETLKEAHKQWEIAKNSDNTVWKISWYNTENNKTYSRHYRIVYNEEENKWDNMTSGGLYITSYTLEKFKEFCELN